jgi:hypothetical protein
MQTAARGRPPSHFASVTAGGFHEPLRIVGSFSFGQYIRIVRLNSPSGAGSQFCSLSLPGESFWIYRSSEPSAFLLNGIQFDTAKRLMGFATKKDCGL